MKTNADHLKGRPPFPFTTIAVAVAFSPRLAALLGEAVRLVDACGARLLLIHVGRKSPEKEKQLFDIIRKHDNSDFPPIIWQTGEPVSVLLSVCKEHAVDLLMLGALRRESMFRYYLGSVARGLSRRAKCSLLLLTEPKTNGSQFSKIMVSCVDNPKTRYSIATAHYFAEKIAARQIHLVAEIDPAGLAMATSDDGGSGENRQMMRQLLNEAEQQLQALATETAGGGVPVVLQALTGRPGFAVRQYAADCHTDLLVINSPDGRYGLIDRIFTHDMEYILEELPANILIVHSRIET